MSTIQIAVSAQWVCLEAVNAIDTTTISIVIVKVKSYILPKEQTAYRFIRYLHYFLSILLYIISSNFIAHLSWKLKWAFLIACCLSVRLSVCPSENFSHFQLLLQNHLANFNQTCHKASVGEGDSSLFKWRVTPFSRGRQYWKCKIILKIFKNLLLQNRLAYLNQTWHKASLGRGIQVCTNEGPRPFPRDDNSENIKLYWKYLNIFFSKITGPISTEHNTEHLWMERIQACSNEGPRPSQGEIIAK